MHAVTSQENWFHFPELLVKFPSFRASVWDFWHPNLSNTTGSGITFSCTGSLLTSMYLWLKPVPWWMFEPATILASQSTWSGLAAFMCWRMVGIIGTCNRYLLGKMSNGSGYPSSTLKLFWAMWSSTLRRTWEGTCTHHAFFARWSIGPEPS